VTVDPRLRAVLDRAEAVFLYGVTSTGVYCRTTCPSRRPRPDRIRLFDSAQDAEDAGFRACLRCRPGTGR
jgi:AraC family transcriptional regulator of adaptative response/methylated-DNA-[protein]-cysteine methyltransferase